MRTMLTGLSGIWNVISLILIFVFILVLAYFAAKIAAKYQSNVLNYRSNIKMVESFRLSNNKFIAIVQIGENYYALGVGKDEVTFIDRLDGDQLVRPEDAAKLKTGDKPGFKEIFAKLREKEPRNKEADPKKPGDEKPLEQNEEKR